MINEAIASAVEMNGEVYAASSRGKKGLVFHGPARQIDAGRYLATFPVALAEKQAFPHETVCGIAMIVVENGLRTLEQTFIFSSRLSERVSPITMTFSVSGPEKVELRVFVSGHAALLIAEDIRLDEIPAGEENYCPFLPRFSKSNQFIRANSSALRSVHEHAGNVLFDDEFAIVEYGGIKLRPTNPEDFAIIYEVFCAVDYDFIPPVDAVFIDVGMNVGMTSLKMAARPYVKEVYAYEPFPLPRKLAEVNFSLNPTLRQKISVFPFGLSSIDETIRVSVEENTTIGTSIRGHGTGVERQIQVRDAAGALASVFASAVNRHLAIVLKLDCEGSEFSILESLEKNDILQQVSILLMEWHKEWSPDLTQDDLIKFLAPHGFAVLDRTLPHNMSSGMLYAVRMAGYS